MELRVACLNNLALLTAVFGIIVSVSLSMVYNHTEATATHCNVKNFFPSVSAAVGRFSPQTQIWQASMLISCLLRLINVYVYQQELRRSFNPRYCLPRRLVIGLHSGLNSGELLGLVGLSMVTSTSHFTIHQDFFILFILCGFLYMPFHLLTINCLVKRTKFMWIRSVQRMKMTCFGCGLSALVSAAYIYKRHNTYCEPGMYSKFAVAEYMIIFFNIAFHACTSFDLRNIVIRLPSCEVWRRGAMLRTADYETRRRVVRINVP